MKLSYKISSIIFFLILLVSVTNYQVLTQTFQNLQTKRLESAEALFGKGLARTIYRQVIEGDRESVTAILFKEKILRENKLDYIIVNDRQGNMFAHTLLKEMPESIDFLSNRFKQDEQYRIDDMLHSTLAVYNIGVPIREGIIQIGTLHIGIGKEFITDAVSPLKKATEKLLFFGLIIIFIGAFLAFTLSFAITKSLTRLQKLALSISQGDYDAEIDVKGKDEVGKLANSLRQMTENIKDAHLKLEQQNLTLEAAVEDRTRQLEEKNIDLEEQRKNLKIAFSAMDFPLYVINKDHTLSMMNDMAQKLLKSSFTPGSTCHSILFGSDSPCDIKENACPLNIIIEGKKPVTLEHSYSTQEGNERFMEVRAYPIFDDLGEVVQIVEACIDITEKKKSERERLQLERELSRAQKLESIGTLAAGVAHEINTPIQFIGDNTLFAEESCSDLFDVIAKYKELLHKSESGEEIDIPACIEKIDEDGDLEYLVEELPKALQQTREGVEHVGNIVKAMKDFSHIGSEFEMQAEDMNHAIETTLTISKNEWKYIADIELRLEKTLPKVHCHVGEIKQVLLNLIVNASHAIADKQKMQEQNTQKGTLIVSSSHDESAVTIAVTDSGMGIDEADKTKIFDPFFTTKEVGKGTGQGLSVTYQIIVDKHRGNIWFESEKGKGTTFYFSLPMQ